MSFGITLFIKADLGLNPLTTFTQGVSLKTGMSVGRSSQVIMIATAIIVLFIDKSRIGIGTLLNGILTGIFIDFLLKIDLNYDSLIIRLIILMFALYIFSAGLGIYVSSNMGEGSVDAFMFIFRERFNLELHKARVILDLLLTLFGILLGSKIGIGTIVSVLFTGSIMNKTIKKINYFGGENEK